MDDKVVSFGKGIHREPSIGAEGELTECVNLYSEGSEMKLMPHVESVRVVPGEWVSAFVHDSGSGWSHLVMSKEVEGTGTTPTKYVKLGWVDFGSEGSSTESVVDIVSLGVGEELKSVTAMGNVLVVGTSKKIYYFLWTEGKYVDYSLDNIGDLDVQFALSGEYVSFARKTVDVVCLNSNSSQSGEEEWNDVVVWQHRGTGSSGKYQCELKASDGTEGRSVKKLSDAATKLKKGHTYSITPENGTRYFKYAVFGIREGYTLDDIKFQGTTIKDVNYDIYATTDGSESGDISLSQKGWKKLDILWMSEGRIGGTITRDADYNTLIFVVTSMAERPDFTVRIKERAEKNKGYTYAIDKDSEVSLDTLKGEMNYFTNEYGRKQNRFIYPFFARIAIKLIDGSYIKPSAPCLLVPNGGSAPDCYIESDTLSTTKTPMMLVVSGVHCDLEYKILGNSIINELKSRKEVIKGIVICVTEPIYTYNSGATAEQWKDSLYLERLTYTEGEGDNKTKVRKVETGLTIARVNNYMNFKYGQWSKMKLDDFFGNTCDYRVTIPEVEDMHKKIIDGASVFRIIKEIDLDELTYNKTKVDLETGTLEGLSGRSMLDENVASLKSYNADALYPYNGRLALGNLRETLFGGYDASTMQGLIDRNGYSVGGVAVVTVNKNNKQYECVKQFGYLNESNQFWFYYPDADATTAKIYRYAEVEDADGLMKNVLVSKTVELEEHKALKGAYWLGDISDAEWDLADEKETRLEDIYKLLNGLPDTKPVIEVHNKMINTYVNNPFVMDEGSASLVGTGSIMAFTSVTKALSQGQFGQHPVLAFCSDGIWALSVSDEGKFLAVQPVSRDVANNVGNITQTDSAVAFTTDKGLMVIDGSSVKQLCEHMDNVDNFDIGVLGELMSEYEDLVVKEEGAFADMLKEAKLVYDYQNSLLWIMPKETDADASETVADGTAANATETEAERKRVKWYAVSLKSGEVYGYVCPDVKGRGLSRYFGPLSIVPNYPQSYMQMENVYARSGAISSRMVLAKFGYTPVSGMRNGWLLTRPICFGDAYSMKLLYDMKVEKMLGSGSSAKVAVYASNDRVHWCRVKSLKGRSYKWFRFALFCELGDSDRVTGLICRIDKRRTNKIR